MARPVDFTLNALPQSCWQLLGRGGRGLVNWLTSQRSDAPSYTQPMFLLGRWKNASGPALAEAAGASETSAAPRRAARRVRMDMRSKLPVPRAGRLEVGATARRRSGRRIGALAAARW